MTDEQVGVFLRIYWCYKAPFDYICKNFLGYLFLSHGRFLLAGPGAGRRNGELIPGWATAEFREHWGFGPCGRPGASAGIGLVLIPGTLARLQRSLEFSGAGAGVIRGFFGSKTWILCSAYGTAPRSTPAVVYNPLLNPACKLVGRLIAGWGRSLRFPLSFAETSSPMSL